MMRVDVRGADRIANGFEQVMRDLPKMEPREVGTVLLAAARSRVPVDTGALRATGRAIGMGITYDAPYAAPIHWGWRERHIVGNPWALRGAESAETQWLGVLADAIQDDINQKV